MCNYCMEMMRYSGGEWWVQVCHTITAWRLACERECLWSNGSDWTGSTLSTAWRQQGKLSQQLEQVCACAVPGKTRPRMLSTHDYRQIMKWRRWSCPYILILNTRCRKCQSCTLIYSSLTSLSLEANLLTSLFGSHRLALLPLLELDTDDIPLDSSIPGLTLQSLSHNSGRDVGELDIVESRCSPEWHDE